jgi:hypothetical protein
MKHKQQLMILPFDHRSSFTKNLLGFEGELSAAQATKGHRYETCCIRCI